MGRVSGSVNSGRSIGPSTSRDAITGIAIRKTDPHQKRSSSSPPTSGPMAEPTEKLDTHTPMATVRWRIQKHVADQGQGRRREGRTGEPQQTAHGD
jgi:hypothetical protein